MRRQAVREEAIAPSCHSLRKRSLEASTKDSVLRAAVGAERSVTGVGPSVPQRSRARVPRSGPQCRWTERPRQPQPACPLPDLPPPRRAGEPPGDPRRLPPLGRAVRAIVSPSSMMASPGPPPGSQPGRSGPTQRRPAVALALPKSAGRDSGGDDPGGRRTSLSETGSDRPKALAVSRRKRDQRPVRAGGRKGQAGPCRRVRPGRGPAGSGQASPLRNRCRWPCSPPRLPERGDEPERSSSSVRRFEAKTEVVVAARASGGYRVRRLRCRGPRGSA